MTTDRVTELENEVRRLRGLVSDQARQKNELRNKLLFVAAEFVRARYVNSGCEDPDGYTCQCCEDTHTMHLHLALQLRRFLDDLGETDKLKVVQLGPHRWGVPDY